MDNINLCSSNKLCAKGYGGQDHDWYFEADIHNDNQRYGIDGGRVTMLWVQHQVRKDVWELIAHYGGGWHIYPQGIENTNAMNEILDYCENIPVRFL